MAITKDNYPTFKRAYTKAVKEGKTQFKFEGIDILTAWAKYACEYAETTLKRNAGLKRVR